MLKRPRVAHISLKRFGKPEDVAAAVKFSPARKPTISTVVSVPARVKVYLVIETITLASVAVQTLRIFPIHFYSSVLVWNFVAIIAVIVLIEISYRLKKPRR